ncbi:hypothetical protein F5141DRAFT_1200368 [Pisolithus sp. B1]|nr:hypothetical protein F5141DRAFT_1200368 [Pisolithus sp. B1]
MLILVPASHGKSLPHSREPLKGSSMWILAVHTPTEILGLFDALPAMHDCHEHLYDLVNCTLEHFPVQVMITWIWFWFLPAEALVESRDFSVACECVHGSLMNNKMTASPFSGHFTVLKGDPLAFYGKNIIDDCRASLMAELPEPDTNTDKLDKFDLVDISDEELPFLPERKVEILGDAGAMRYPLQIMRHIARKIVTGEGDQLGDFSTIAKPSVIEVIKKKVAESV